MVIDGTPVDFPNFNMNSNNIKSVVVLKDAAATAIYGSRGSNGVIIINSFWSKNVSRNINLNKKSDYVYETFYENSVETSYKRVFSHPVYESPVTNYRTDFRETIYWNPTVQTDKNG